MSYTVPALLALAGALNAPESGAALDGGTGILTRAPMLLRQVEAPFPPEALDAGIGGTVVLEIDLSAEGKVTSARVEQSAGPAFDESALQAVRQFEFSPALVDGAPAAVRLLYSYEFLYRSQVVETAPATDAVNFGGVLLERGTRRPLPGASVAVLAGPSALEATSDGEGRFELRGVPAGTWPVVVQSPEHARYEVAESFAEGQRTVVTYFVRRQVYSTYETVVRAPRERKEVARVSLRQEEVRLIPGTQGDALKVVQNLPGVSRSPYSVGLLVVRGGKPWDTRVYVDDVLVPLLFHFGGLYATFNSSLLEEISFEPGNFGAEHGRNIGGLVRARTRVASGEGLHGYVDGNALDLSAMVEGPLGGHWTGAVAARRSYIDAVLPAVVGAFAPQAQDALTFTLAPRYYDYQAKLDWRPEGSTDRLSVSLFGSSDEMAFVLPNPAYDPEGRGSFDTLLAYHRLAVNYDKQLGPALRFLSHNALGIDRYELGAGTDIFYRATMFPLMAREGLEVELPEQKLSLSFGADLYFAPFDYDVQGPPRFKLNQIPDPFVSRQLLREATTQWVFEPAVYAEAVFRPWPALKLVPSLRADYDAVMNDAWIDPRLSVLWETSESLTLKAAAGLFHQPPDFRQGYLSPRFGNPDLLPEGAAHYSLGAEHRLTEAVSLDVQLYYKQLFQQTQPTLAAPAGAGAGIDEVELAFDSTGVGRSYGAELLLRHQLTRNFFGWVSYSLSRSERAYPGREGYGLHPLDQPHHFIAVASYKLPRDFIAGVRVRYASGPLTTELVGAIYDVNGNYYYPLFGELFTRRLPDFFQLDVRIDKRFVFERWMLALYADVQNVTNRKNVETVLHNFDYTQEQYIYGLPILPTIGVRGEF